MSILNEIFKNSRNPMKSINKLMVYKKQNIILLLCLFVFGLISCVKQSECEDCKEGILTKKFESNSYYEENNVKAVLIIDSITSYGITGYIPNVFKNNDSVAVCVTLKMASSNPSITIFTPNYKINCIE